jgi:hypothetical protein
MARNANELSEPTPQKGPAEIRKKSNPIKSQTLNTKVWLDGPTLARVQKETDGTPKSLSPNPGNWMQGYDICAGGFK